MVCYKGLSLWEVNVTFNNISAKSLLLVLLVEETDVSGENHHLATSQWQKLSN
jgi:hypothetical protein